MFIKEVIMAKKDEKRKIIPRNPFSGGVVEEKIDENQDPDTEIIAEPVEQSKPVTAPSPEVKVENKLKPVEEIAHPLLLKVMLDGMEGIELTRSKRMLRRLLEPPTTTAEAALKSILLVLLEIYDKITKK